MQPPMGCKGSRRDYMVYKSNIGDSITSSDTIVISQQYIGV